ncbi:hypothetical protein INT48_000184 [Thamnidium elegans]|uniref:G-patch domain-containing protein n=1 Tax=Thamnidium elegans TaxID=101142 RepID=A0A8H7SW50_9FUNG|nr:hypothetical protein INT48_000184 [Thamnidium elegans]
MFNQQPQKPAFKFVIKSKIETVDSSTPSNPAKQDDKITIGSIPNLDDRKRKRPTNESVTPIATKKIHSQLLKWNKKKEELKQEDKSEVEKAEAKNDFADLSALTCLLCQRKFKAKVDLLRHIELSDLHKNNLKDPIAVNKATLKLNFLKSQDEKKKEEQAVEYRNRAAERRLAYGQPEKPVLSPPSSPPRQISRELQVSTDIKKVLLLTCARMLAQMGWKKGEGLGKDGTGILDPVKAESYGQSAGIGSTAKRDLGGSDGSYRTRTIDAARKRYLGGGK